jgi:glycosyltransferase involved in cell wall biosynthesis
VGQGEETAALRDHLFDRLAERKSCKMHIYLLLLAIATLAFFTLFGIDLYFGNRSTAFLRDESLEGDAAWPRVSVVIPARNEQRGIREALQSVLQQEYPNAECIVINDRSTDQTGAILAEMAARDARLHVITISELPAGWLGKNYALYRGAEAATGELILFADADVVMDRSVIARAVSYMRKQGLQHLAILPEIRMPGVLLGMFTSAFGIFFSLYARPWKAKDPKSKRSVGIGAFNLVSAEAYRAAGTHRAIAMRPDDDLKLGKLLKKHGYRQELMFGGGMMHVEWYSSVREMVDGLMKNSFSGVGYSVAGAIASGIALLLGTVWPVLGAVFTRGNTQLLNLAIVAVLLFISADSNRFHSLPRWYALGLPLGGVLFTYILWKATLKTILEDGIRWRGTHYPLALLKANKI